MLTACWLTRHWTECLKGEKRGGKKQKKKNTKVFLLLFNRLVLKSEMIYFFSNYLICFWIQHGGMNLLWAHTEKFHETIQHCRQWEFIMSRQLPFYLLQTVKELTCLQELNSCWQKPLWEEAAPWGIQLTNTMICSPCTFLCHGSLLYFRCSQKLVINITTTN